MDVSNWDFSDTTKGLLESNLVIINEIVRNENLAAKPRFEILGGAGLIFSGVSYRSTIDIDTANKIDESILSKVEYFINDSASEVVTLPSNYKDRLVPFKQDVLTNIEVYVLSKEDIVFTKLASYRQKDFAHIKSTNILKMIDENLMEHIIDTECDNPIIKMRVKSLFESLIVNI